MDNVSPGKLRTLTRTGVFLTVSWQEDELSIFESPRFAERYNFIILKNVQNIDNTIKFYIPKVVSGCCSLFFRTKWWAIKCSNAFLT